MIVHESFGVGCIVDQLKKPLVGVREGVELEFKATQKFLYLWTNSALFIVILVLEETCTFCFGFKKMEKRGQKSQRIC